MAQHSAGLRRALAAAAAGATLALAAASPALATPGDFTVSGPASFPAAVAVGQSATQTYTVTNHTASPWEFGGIGFPPNGNGDFSWSVIPVLTCPSSGSTGVIAAGESCTIPVQFTPNSAGVHSLNFQLNFFPIGGGFGDQANIVTVTATGFDVALSLSPGGLTFPDQPLGTVGPAQAVTVTALRASTTVSAARVTGAALNDFLISNDGCSQTTLAATGDHCTLWLRSSPTALGPSHAALQVTAGAETETVSLTGNGVPAPAGVPGPPGRHRRDRAGRSRRREGARRACGPGRLPQHRGGEGDLPDPVRAGHLDDERHGDDGALCGAARPHRGRARLAAHRRPPAAHPSRSRPASRPLSRHRHRRARAPRALAHPDGHGQLTP